ncbi:MAG: non-canonical purine NTP pyrophosphatase, partial [Wenzhouxiangellaceae bacterium]
MRKFKDDTLLVATHNTGKLEEIAHLLEPYGVRVTSAADHDLPEPAETETSFV